jgi:hypothetical protein
MELLGLLALIFVAVPFVLPIVSWVSARRTRARVEELEATLKEQGRVIEGIKGELVRIRRELRQPGTGADRQEAPATSPARAAPERAGPARSRRRRR